MELWSPSSYRVEASAAGMRSEAIEAALAQARKVQAKGLPAILTLGHLAWYTQQPYEKLRDVVSRRRHPYRVFQIHKHAGGTRSICVPEPWLRQVQRWIHDHVLVKQAAHQASNAYQPGQSPLLCAKQHVGCKWLVKLDIQQFFESISERKVYKVFRGFGYEPLVSFELTRLTTRHRVAVQGRILRAPKWRTIVVYANAGIGALPQGAPSSPLLANLAVRGLDAELWDLAESKGFTYTRYSDDMCFSATSRDVGVGGCLSLVRAARERLVRWGLRPHTAKTRILGPGHRKTVLGLLVDGDRPRLPREVWDELRAHSYYLKSRGPVEHARARNFKSVFAMRRHLEGVLSYAISVDPERGSALREEFASVTWPL